MRDLPVRKSIRLKGYDYSQTGSYFVTICVKNKHEILGEIVGDAALGVPRMELTEIGINVKKHIEHINHVSEKYRLDHYVIMPNHVHLLITIEDETPGTNGTPRAASPTKATIPKIINSLKSLTSKEFGESLWQRAYHDHIIRNETEYQKIWQYIDENPTRWREDCYFAEVNKSGGLT